MVPDQCARAILWLLTCPPDVLWPPRQRSARPAVKSKYRRRHFVLQHFAAAVELLQEFPCTADRPSAYPIERVTGTPLALGQSISPLYVSENVPLNVHLDQSTVIVASK